MRIVFDISETLAHTINGLYGTSVTRQLSEIQRSLINIMGAIDTLRTEVNNLQTTSADGFAALESAFSELASDIAAIPDADDVDAESARVAAVSQGLAASTAGLAQRLRDAVPTDAPTEPLPPVETEVPEPAPEA